MLDPANDVTTSLAAFLRQPPKEKKNPDHDTRVLRGNAMTITIPEDMEYSTASRVLFEQAKQDESTLNRTEAYSCHPHDGYLAFTRLMRHTFGWMASKPVRTMAGLQKPDVRRIPISLTETEEAFVNGIFSHPQLPDVEFQLQGDVDQMIFQVRVTARQKHGSAINVIFNELRRRIGEDSIYRGKAINSEFAFLDVRNADWQKIILPYEEERQVKANIFSFLMNPAAVGLAGVPFKRGVILEGDYGGGKTLIANAAAHLAELAGITFLYIAPEHFGRLPTFLMYARHYAPCVLFYEDVDQIAHGDERDGPVNMILNEMDGLENKEGAGNQVMVIMTTNHIGRINPALLRPGRLDAVIHIGETDAHAAKRLLRLYGGDKLGEDFDYEMVGEACVRMAPAFIREVIERSKLYAIADRPQEEVVLTTQNVLDSIASIKRQLDMAKPPDLIPTAKDRFWDSFRTMVGGVVDQSGEEMVRRTLVPNIQQPPDENHKALR